MTAHALLSPSGAHRWVACPGSIALSASCADEGSSFADEGTAAHSFAAEALLAGVRPSDLLGLATTVNGIEYLLDDDMAGHLDSYVEYVRAAQGADGMLLVEQRVAFGAAIGQPDDIAFGTADALIVRGSEVAVVDLKYGRGVAVSAEANEQLMLYALGALPIAELAARIETVRLVISQPRVSAHPSEWSLSVDELLAFAASVAPKAADALCALRGDTPTAPLLAPGEETCRWCIAKAGCPALAESVREAVAGSFPDLTIESAKAGIRNLDSIFSDALGAKMAVVGLVEDWCKAVRARAESELLAGRGVTGFKLVEGRKGARQWTDPVEAEALLRGFRLRTEDMFHMKLISPTDAEKLVKSGTIGPRQAPKLDALVTQSPGRPSVAPVDDRRPAYSVAGDFEDLTQKD